MTLRVDRVVFSRGSRMIIDGVDCTVPSGTVTALIGPNGAGKSTLLHLIAATLRAQAGHFRLDHTDLAQLSRKERARRVALVEQQADTDLDLTVTDVVMLGRIPHLPGGHGPGRSDRAIVEAAVAAAGASMLATRRFRDLSGGERQRVLLARALAQQPRLLLLDEPTNHLDIRAQLDTLALMRTLADSGLTVLAAMHDLNLTLAHADHVIVLAGGTVTAAGPVESTLTAQLIGEVYGVDAELIPRGPGARPVIAVSRPSR